LHTLVLEQCTACGLVQLAETVPAADLRPVYAWIAYHEPDEHLYELVEQILRLPGVNRESVLCGISINDDPLLRRLAERGYSQSWRVDLERDLGVSATHAGIETLQHCLGPEQAQRIVARHGRASVVIARYSFEHANDPGRFMAALRVLARPDGFIVIEVPDCARSLADGDAGAIWEEHVLYFTPATLPWSLARLGFQKVNFSIYAHELEDSLVCIVAAGEYAARSIGAADLSVELRRAARFVDRLPGEGERWHALLSEHTRAKRKVALFGAGHRSCTLISLLGLAKHLEFVVDDDPNKVGLFMPGSRLSIVPSSRLHTDDISVCLLSLSPTGQRRVVERNRAFIERGGTFLPLGMDTINSSSVAEDAHA
jgi:hypothetical protein